MNIFPKGYLHVNCLYRTYQQYSDTFSIVSFYKREHDIDIVTHLLVYLFLDNLEFSLEMYTLYFFSLYLYFDITIKYLATRIVSIVKVYT